MTAPDPAKVLARVLRRLEPGERRAYLERMLAEVVKGLAIIDGERSAAEQLGDLLVKIYGEG